MNTVAYRVWRSPQHTGQLLYVISVSNACVDYERWAVLPTGLWRVLRTFALGAQADALFTEPVTDEEEKRFIEERNLYNSRGRGIVSKKS